MLVTVGMVSMHVRLVQRYSKIHIYIYTPSGSCGQQEALKPICQRLKLMHHVASPWQTKSVCVQLTHV